MSAHWADPNKHKRNLLQACELKLGMAFNSHAVAAVASTSSPPPSRCTSRALADPKGCLHAISQKVKL